MVLHLAVHQNHLGEFLNNTDAQSAPLEQRTQTAGGVLGTGSSGLPGSSTGQSEMQIAVLCITCIGDTFRALGSDPSNLARDKGTYADQNSLRSFPGNHF